MTRAAENVGGFLRFFFDWMNERDPDLVAAALAAYDLTPEAERLRKQARNEDALLAARGDGQ